MNNLVKFGQSLFGNFLKSPEDSLLLKVTKTGKQVIKASTSERKVSIVRYPETNTIVKTEVFREK